MEDTAEDKSSYNHIEGSRSPLYFLFKPVKVIKKKRYTDWKDLTEDQKAVIVKDYENGVVRNVTLREYGITSDQYCSIIRKASVQVRKK